MRPTILSAAVEKRGRRKTREAVLVKQELTGTEVVAVTMSRGEGTLMHDVWAAKKTPFNDPPWFRVRTMGW